MGGYEVISLIGRGATGTVYLARDVALKRQVALKVLLGSTAQNPALVKSFHHEAQTAAPLRHPGIVRIYSAGVEQGTPYIAMEYIAGETLDRFLRRKGRVHWTTALYIAHQVADALDCAHSQGVVHRDVKPANILLDQQGKVHLTDFGIARIRTGQPDQADSRAFAGTPKYMAPEQVAGEEVTFSADLYALGVTMYQMMSCELPFEAETPMALIKKITNDPAPRLNRIIPEVPDDVARLVAHLLEKKPHDRPPSARVVSQTIDRLQVERGGRSAIPAALAAFIREYNDISISTTRGSRHPGHQTGGPGGVRDNQNAMSFAMSVVAVLIASLLLWAGGAILLVWSLLPQPIPPPAPAAGMVTLEELAPGVQRALLAPNAPFSISELSWNRARTLLLARATGLPTTLAYGGEGIIAIDPVEHAAINLASPVLPAETPEYWKTTLPRMYALGPRHLLKTVPWPRGRNKSQLALLAQQADRSRPDLAVLGRFDGVLWRPGSGLPWDASTLGGATLHPSGTRACLALNDFHSGFNYLVERDLRSESLDQIGPRLTKCEGRILPETVRYSFNGNMLGYIRETQQGQRQLWVLWPSTAKPEGNGTPVAIGNLDVNYCFSPSGQQILLGVRTDDSPWADLRIVDIETGNVRVRLGRGQLGPGSWHQSGAYVIVVAPGANDATEQTTCLWRIDVKDPSLRTSLLEAPGAIGSSLSLSQDGRWLAVAAAGSNSVSSIVLVDLAVFRVVSSAAWEDRPDA